jgi:hydrogenase maturation factor
MSDQSPLPVGKLPAPLLASLLAALPADPALAVRPAVGEDIAAIDLGDRFLIAKTDPITFAADRAGDYLACVNANDIATAGARPRWCLVTALLPQDRTTPDLVRELFDQLTSALARLGVTLCGGHTEITAGLDRPILVGCMLGEVAKDRLVDKRRARPGDTVLMTGSVPVEGTAIIARDCAERLRPRFSEEEIARAADCLDDPGICVVDAALAAADAARVHAMHDVTEGGLATGLCELADATGTGIRADARLVSLDPLGARICEHLGLNPLGLISSGTLLIACDPADAGTVRRAVAATGTPAAPVATLTDNPAERVLLDADGSPRPLPRFEPDEIARLFA